MNLIASSIEGPLPPLPTFLIIGAQKSATRWLRINLGLHPDIYAAPVELEFFSITGRYHGKGELWYRSQFRGWQGESIVGESTPGYMMLKRRPEIVSKRILRLLPEVRLIAILRNPVDRAQSALRHHIRRGRLPIGARLADLIRSYPPGEDRWNLIGGGLYAASLEPFIDRFGERLLVLLHDDLVADSGGVYRTALEHVGASAEFVPEGLEKVRFSNQPADGPPDQSSRLPNFLKRKSSPDLVFDLSFEERAQLFDLFRDDVASLERLIGRDLSCWDPDSATQRA